MGRPELADGDGGGDDHDEERQARYGEPQRVVVQEVDQHAVVQVEGAQVRHPLRPPRDGVGDCPRHVLEVQKAVEAQDVDYHGDDANGRVP